MHMKKNWIQMCSFVLFVLLYCQKLFFSKLQIYFNSSILSRCRVLSTSGVGWKSATGVAGQWQLARKRAPWASGSCSSLHHFCVNVNKPKRLDFHPHCLCEGEEVVIRGVVNAETQKKQLQLSRSRCHCRHFRFQTTFIEVRTFFL